MASRNAKGSSANPWHEAASAASEEEMAAFGSNAVDPNALRIGSLADFVTNGAKEAFDPAVYIACKRYLLKQESARIAAQQVINEELLPSSDFNIMSWSERVHTVLTYPFRTRAGRVMIAVEVTLIIITMVSIIVESMPQYNPDIHTGQVASWTILDGLITNIFLIQLVVAIAVHPPPKRHVVFSLRTLVDVLTILPFYVQLFTDPSHRNFLGMLKALRILRVGHLATYATSFHIILLSMFKASKVLLAPIMLLVMINFTLGAAVYFAERGQYDPVAQKFMMHDCVCEAGADYVLGLKLCPQKESVYFSILHSMWLMIQATTTVGYGDMVPLCDWGKILTTIGMFVGSLVLSIPIAVVGSYYSMLQFEKTERLKSLKRQRTAQGSLGSFSSVASSTELRTTVTHLSSVIESVKQHGPKSAGEHLCSFLQQNVSSSALPLPKPPPGAITDDTLSFMDPMHKSGSALTHLNLYYPSSEVMYFLQMYLEDFSEELALRGRDAGVPREVAQLIPTSSASLTTHAGKLVLVANAVGDGSLPLEGSPSRLGPKPDPPLITKHVAPVQVGLTKARHTFTVQVFERLGDDTLTSTGMQRKFMIAAEKAKAGARKTRPHEFTASVGAPPLLFPGMYKATTTARVSLVRQRGIVIPGQEAIHVGEIFTNATIAFAPNAGADHITYLVEPWTKSTREALPRLLSATLGEEHQSRLSKAMLTDGYFVSERQLYSGNVVAIRGTSYQYLDDDMDLEAAIIAFECAIAEVMRFRAKSVSKLLHGMPVKPLPAVLGGGQERGGGSSPSPSPPNSRLRRRGASPQQVPDEAASRFGAPPERASQLHAAHVLPDGELSMPFLSRIAIASAQGVAPAVEAERQRAARLKQFSRDLAGGGRDGW